MKREKIALLTTIIYIAIMGVGMITANIVGIKYGTPDIFKVIFFFEVIMSILVVVIYKRLGLNLFKTKFKFSKWTIPYIVILIIGIVTLVTTGKFTESLPLLFLVLISTMLVGFSEELMFRGILLNVLLEKRSTLFAIMVSSAGFSLLHVVNLFANASLKGTIVQLIDTFLVGLIFSCILILTKNIIPLMIFHFVWDFVLISNPITHAKVELVTILDILITFIIVVPIMVYTVKRTKNERIAR